MQLQQNVHQEVLCKTLNKHINSQHCKTFTFHLVECNLDKLWLEPILARVTMLCGVSEEALQGLLVLYVSCVRMCSLLWFSFVLLASLSYLTSLPFAGNGKYMIVQPLTLSVWQCLVVVTLRVAMDTSMLCLRLVSWIHHSLGTS